MTVPDHDELDIGTGDFAISLWFTREKDEKDNLRLLSKYDKEWRGYALWGGNESIRFDVGAGKGSKRVGVSGKIPKLGEWVHVVVNVEYGKKITMYVNGKLAGEQTLSTLGAANLGSSTDLTIGTGSGLTWRGLIDDVRIYKRLISEKEIADVGGDSIAHVPRLHEATKRQLTTGYQPTTRLPRQAFLKGRFRD